MTEVFKKALNNDKLTVKVEKLKNENISSIITLSEEGRRMQDMMKMYAMNGMGGMDMNMFAADQTLTLNANNELVKYIFEHKDSENVPMFCEQLYDLAVLSNHPLSVDEMTKFVERSNKNHDAAGKINRNIPEFNGRSVADSAVLLQVVRGRYKCPLTSQNFTCNEKRKTV